LLTPIHDLLKEIILREQSQTTISSFVFFELINLIYKMRAKYLACKGGDESPRAEGTKSMI